MNFNSPKLLKSASILKVLGHPLRISIMELLQESEQLTVTQIFQALKVEQAIASHHLNTLKNKQVLNSRRVGKNTFYSVSDVKLLLIIKSVLEVK